MTEQYEPRKLEIIGEMGRSTLRLLSPLRGSGGIIRECLSSFGKGLMDPFKLYYIPTEIRRELTGESDPEVSGLRAAGLFAGLSVHCGAWGYGLYKCGPKIFIPFLVANVASGGYEILRYSYNSAKKKLIEQKRTQTNDDLVSRLGSKK
ncbi:MAG: hypothetical protein WCK90_03565 [archaeon]